MEILKKRLPAISIAILASTALVGCGDLANEINPAKSVTHDADEDGGATKDILAAYPDAENIRVTHANDNPNYMSFEIDEGRIMCTTLASATATRSDTPGAVITVPFCRPNTD